MPRRSRRRLLAAIVLAALLALLLPPLITLKSYSARVQSAMEQALGHRVSVGRVHLRLLPRPGFDLDRLVIADDPAFGAEPILRADRVTVQLRLASLWDRRLEIARLTLKSGSNINPPSLNLVRAPDGRWNIETLLERTAQTPSAPTAETHAEARPRFPYIEANGGRINFMIGAEKTVYAVIDADFALWLASEDEWAFRLQARPMRSDFNLSDLGVLKISGRFRRAATLHDTPLEINASWQKAQLGQLTKLMDGRDRGWRGAVQFDAHLSGTPAALKLTADARVQDFRRYDISNTESLRLAARCSANYSSNGESFSGLDCRAPVGNGAITVTGSLTGGIHPRAYDFDISLEHVGLPALVALARHAKRDVPADLAAEGTLAGQFQVHKTEAVAAPQWTGQAHTSAVILRSSVLSPALSVSPLALAVQQASHRDSSGLPLRLAIKPFSVALGGATPATVSAWFAASGYDLETHGEARIPRLLQSGLALGLRVPRYKAEGTTKFNAKVAGTWFGFTPPLITGNAQLRNVTAPWAGLNAPVQIAAGDLTLAPQAVSLQRLRVRFPGSPLQVSGSLLLPRNCETLEQCPVHFDLASAEVSLDSLNRLLNPSYAKRPWYDVFGGNPPRPVLARIQASGHLRIHRLTMRSLQAKLFTADAQLDAGKLTFTQVRAEFLGAQQRGEWHADFTGDEPSYTGSGTVTGLSVKQLGGLMRDDWGEGVADASYKLSLSGWSASQLAASAEGVASFNWQNGVLRHIHITQDEASAPLQFRRLGGQLQVRDGVLTFSQGKMTTPAGVYEVSGTASLARQLGLKLRSGGRVYNISGPLDRPTVAALSTHERAALKP